MAEYISFQPSDFFSPLIYTGTGSAHAITGVGFQPDLIITKERGSENWGCIDAVRGVQEAIYPNLTTAETTEAQSITAFGSDGFSVGTSTTWNTSGAMVCWNWKAETTTGIAGSPSITPTSYSFNATSGFSIIKYVGNGTSGATVPHGLGVAPKMIIVKELSGADSWLVYHQALGNTKYLQLNAADSASTSTGKWNDTSPTSTLFSLGSNTDVNASGADYIAYCFAEKKGYAKDGSYVANGNVDGDFIYLGFRPALIILKKTSASADWFVWDNKRVGYNPDNNFLNFAATSSESTANDIDFLSNGFKMRSTNAEANTGTLIYMAFAEFPIVSSNDIPALAR